MPYLGICVESQTCGICKTPLLSGDRCFHDPSKTPINALAHEKCWIDLRTERGTAIIKPKAKKTGKNSDIPLDPPF